MGDGARRPMARKDLEKRPIKETYTRVPEVSDSSSSLSIVSGKMGDGARRPIARKCGDECSNVGSSCVRMCVRGRVC